MPRKDKNQRLGTASAPKLEGKNELEKLKQLSSFKYEHQAKWFLNVSFFPTHIFVTTHNTKTHKISGILDQETSLVLVGR